MLPIKTVGAPGAHGDVVRGTHGMGVNTPNAAVVAAATVGLAKDEHIPNGGTFTMGLKSIIFAAGVPVRVRFSGSTTNVDGATPKLHIIEAPMQTCIAIALNHLFR